MEDRPKPEVHSAYEDALDHLRDEVERVSLIIALRLQDARAGQGDAVPESGEQQASLAQRLEGLRQRTERRIRRSRESRVELPLERLRRVFQLEPFELDVLLACVAPLVDSRQGDLYSRLHGDAEKRYPTGELLLELLAPTPEARAESVEALHPRGALFAWQLLHVEGGDKTRSVSWFLRPLLADLHILEILLGHRGLEPQVARELRPVHPEPGEDGTSQGLGSLQRHLEQNSERLARGEPGGPIFIHVRGADAEQAVTRAATAAASLGLRLFALRAEWLMGLVNPSVEALWEGLRRVMRDVLLYGGSLLVTEAEALGESVSEPESPRRAVLTALAELAPLIFLQSDDERLEAEVRRALPDSELRWVRLQASGSAYEHRREAWARALAASGLEHSLEGFTPEVLAARYELSTAQIRGAVATAVDLACSRPVAESVLRAEDLRAGVRGQTQRALGELVTRVDVRHRWEELVLPEGSLAQLREICVHHTRRHTVLETWGFGERLRRGLGIHALFCGPPGTGKTMAASIIAEQLELELFRIDLSTVVSKYIGETEKNLARIFREALPTRGILFFDEADALFSKRTKVESSHDRYANLETGYLLQRIEDYPGITLLATNLSKNLDEAFMRRLAFVVDFPFPSPGHRRSILEKLLPAEAPRAEDVSLDFLGERLTLSGGSLKNVVLRAAFSAAEEQEPIRMRHLLFAARHEYAKQGKAFLPSDFPEYQTLFESL